MDKIIIHLVLTDNVINVSDLKNFERNYTLENFANYVSVNIRKVADLLDIKFDLSGVALRKTTIRSQNKALKYENTKMTLSGCSFLYFCYCYLFKCICIDGVEGFIWTSVQGWWFRTLVDAKAYEIKNACDPDKMIMHDYSKEHYRVGLTTANFGVECPIYNHFDERRIA